MFNYRPLSTEPIHRERVFQDGDNQICKTIDETKRLGCLHDRCIPSCPIHPQSRKYLQFVYEDQVFLFTALPFRMSSPLIFSKLMNVIAAFLRQRAISVFPYLDDWLIKDLIRNQLISQTKFCIQTIQKLSEIHIHRNGISNSVKFSQDSNRSSREPSSDNQINSIMQTNIGTNFPFSFGPTQCKSRFCSPRQTSLRSPANVSSVCLETSYSSS